MIKLPKVVEEWCDSHTDCKGCKFLGAECVAPQSDSRYGEWIDGMFRLIVWELEDDNR